MYNEAQRNEAKANFIEHLTEKTKEWKGDTAKYIRNAERLMRDDIVDIVTGKIKVVEFKDQKGALLKLKDGLLPFANIVRYDAMVAYAAEMGIELAYDVSYIGKEARVEFAASGEVPLTYFSERMESTKAAVLEVLASEVPTEADMLKAIPVKSDTELPDNTGYWRKSMLAR